MALATTEGTWIYVSTNASGRDYQTYGFGTTLGHTYKYHIVSKEEVYELVALTKAAAKTIADAASQSGLTGGIFASYVASEDSRTIGSAKVTKTITYPETTTVTDIPP